MMQILSRSSTPLLPAKAKRITGEIGFQQPRKILTSGDEIPLYSPMKRSSRMIVLIAWRVDWYLPAMAGL